LATYRNVTTGTWLNAGLVTASGQGDISLQTMANFTYTHTHSLQALSNVTVTDPVFNQFLRWNGTLWVNSTFTGDRTIVTESGTSRTNVSADSTRYVRWTNEGAKGYVISGNVSGVVAGNVWEGFVASSAGNLILSQGSNMTLSGRTTFLPGDAYCIVFTSATTADVLGGAS
jgi:hypothetical protein